ncbi:MAG: membrane protein insertase YidC [Bacteroidia bacterium]|nr:membrane protein insertase YidC [Bacteroidia bacterium]
MDRNTVIGMVLIGALVVTWFFLVGDPTGEKKQPQGQTNPELVADTLYGNPDTSSEPNIVVVPTGGSEDSLADLREKQRIFAEFGDFAPAATGEQKFITVVTDRYTLRLNTLGGKIEDIYLNPQEYVTWDQKPLAIQTDDPENSFAVEFDTKGDRPRIISSELLYFVPDVQEEMITVSGESTRKIVLKAAMDSRRYITFTYTFKGDKYDFGMDIAFVGMENSLKNKTYYINWASNLPQTEKSIKEVRAKTFLQYREAGDVEKISARGTDPKNEKGSSTSVDWVGYKNQFFTQTLLTSDPQKGFSAFDLTLTTPPNDSYDKRMESRLTMTGTDASLTWYAGPLKYGDLKAYDRQLERQIDLGYSILKYINSWVIIPLFKFLEGAVGNYGIIILILAIFIKIVVFPMTYKSYISMAKMRVINSTPEMKALDEKYKDDPTKLQQEKLAFQRKAGVSPFGGCLPMILQYPILISIFFFFPNSIELRQESFLWANDLSTYDSILDLPFSIPGYGDHVSLFTILMAISLMFFTIVNQKSQATMANNPLMKYMPYFMPIMLLVFLNNYSAGLSYYYLLSNLLSIAQTTITKRFIDDEKLLAQLHEKQKAKGKDGEAKKGRIEKWMDEQQKKQREFQKSRSGGSGKGSGGKKR